MNPWVASYFFLAAVMDALIGKDPSSGTSLPLQVIYFGLFQSPTPNPTPALLQSGITECNYTGYARQACVWFPTNVSLLGPQEIVGALLQYRPTDSVAPNTATGVFVSDKLTGGDLLLSALLNPALPLNSPVQVVNVTPGFLLPFTPIYGQAAISA
jgi:hypothetical protein